MAESTTPPKPTGTTVGEIDYLQAGSLVWGKPPFGTSPIAWECQRCFAVVLSPSKHSDWHRDLVS